MSKKIDALEQAPGTDYLSVKNLMISCVVVTLVSLFEQVNDTVGALSFGHFHDPDTIAAVVFGTGSNACYLERTDAIIKCQNPRTTSGSMVIIIKNRYIVHL